jgi:hypothetical protein
MHPVEKSCIPSRGWSRKVVISRNTAKGEMHIRFKNIDVLLQHQRGQTLKDFNEAAEKEDLFESPVVVKVVGSATGFVI